MRTTSRDRPRRRARSACGLALVLALVHGSSGCAHQLTNAELATGVVMVAGIAALAVTLGGCNELTTQCRSPEGRVLRPGPSFPSALALPQDGAPR
jgi:hypothetical protein